MRKDRERGAIVVEATLSLTAFVFTIFTILTLVNVYFIQAKMGVALNTAAKEISQYSYLYYALGINDYDAAMSQGAQDAGETAKQTIDDVGSLMSALSDASVSSQTGDFDKMFEAIKNGAGNVNSLVTTYGDKLANDPKSLILGMGKLVVNDFKESHIKAVLGQTLAKAFMKKNLIAYPGDDADAFLKRYRVVNGMAGLDFNYTTLMANGTSNEIQLCVTYDVSVIKLLNMDFKFTFRQLAKTCAWGNGISLIYPKQNAQSGSASTVWDNTNHTERGKIIVSEEKKKYTYTASRQGFDAYNNAGGANEFVTIMSTDTTLERYQNAKGIKDAIKSNYSEMEASVSWLGETIKVQNKSGATVSLTSNRDSRTYKIVLVIPDNSDMTLVNQAIADFKKEHPDVVVEVNKNYGSPTSKTNTEQNKQQNGS